MINAGISNNVDLSYLDYREQGIAEIFSTIWYITFAKKTIFKGTDYSYIFGKPTDYLKEKYNLEKEILILFSPYKSFNFKNLDFVDKLMEQYNNRLDKLSLILISNDLNINSLVRSHTEQNRESRLIISFTYEELNTGYSNIIEEKLKKIYYGRDLFDFEGALNTDTYFFGRNDLIKNLYDKYKNGENAGVFGLRRIGKTSVLLGIKRYLKFRDEPVIFIDCQEPTIYKQRWNQVLYTIIESIKKEYDIQDISFNKFEQYDDTYAPKRFEEDLEKIYELMGCKRILIMLDEIEHITFESSYSSYWNEEMDFIYFWQTIKAIYQKKPDIFSVIIAGVNPKLIETSKIRKMDNPIYRIIAINYITLFDLVSIKEMVSSIGKYLGLKFSDEVFTYLKEDLGGHPFLIRQMCSRIHKNESSQRPITINQYTYFEYRKDISNFLKDYIELILNVLIEWYPSEYELLEYLAIGDFGNFKEYAEESMLFIEHLTGYGIIIKEGSKYYIRIKALEEYVKDKSKYVRKNMSVDEKWAYINRTRNSLEFKLKKLIKNVLRLSFGKDAKNKFVEILSKSSAKEKVKLISYDEIFDSTNKTELYFEDLRICINKYWEIFSNVFEGKQDDFNFYMRKINEYRSDCHSNILKEEEIALYNVAFNWINDRVKLFS